MKGPTTRRRPTSPRHPQQHKHTVHHPIPHKKQATQPAKSRSARKARRQNHSWLWALVATSAVLLMIVLYAILRGSQGTGNSGTRTYPTPGPLLAVGSVAPDFTLYSVAGREISLHQYRGQVVVLELFAPWCPNCQAETATIKQVQTTYAGKGVQVLNVSASPYGHNYEASGGTDTTPISMGDLEWYQTTFGLNYPSLFDPTLKVGAEYGVTVYPTLYIINASGTITFVNTGVMSLQAFEQQIQQEQGTGS